MRPELLPFTPRLGTPIAAAGSTSATAAPVSRRLTALVPAPNARTTATVRRREQAPVVQAQDAVGDRRRLGFVGDEHHRALLEASEQRQHRSAVVMVEVAGGLVGEHELRVVDERASDREPLLLAAGELVRAAVRDLRQTELLDQPAAATSTLTSSSTRRRARPVPTDFVIPPA
jgi:hypothetical protein